MVGLQTDPKWEEKNKEEKKLFRLCVMSTDSSCFSSNWTPQSCQEKILGTWEWKTHEGLRITQSSESRVLESTLILSRLRTFISMHFLLFDIHSYGEHPNNE